MTPTQGQRLIRQVTDYRLRLAAIEQTIAADDWTAIQVLQPLAAAQEQLDVCVHELEEVMRLHQTRDIRGGP